MSEDQKEIPHMIGGWGSKAKKTAESQQHKEEEKEEAEQEQQNNSNTSKCFSKVNWRVVESKIPTDRTAESKKQRFQLFNTWDMNLNGFMYLAELDKGLEDHLRADLIDKARIDMKPIVLRGFNEVTALFPHKEPSYISESVIRRSEVCMFFIYVKNYLKIVEIFDEAGQCDLRLSRSEFEGTLPKLKEFIPARAAENIWDQICPPGNKTILFADFSNWVLPLLLAENKELDSDEDN